MTGTGPIIAIGTLLHGSRLELNSKGKTYANAMAYGRCSVGLRGGKLCADQAYVQNRMIEVSPKDKEVHM